MQRTSIERSTMLVGAIDSLRAAESLASVIAIIRASARTIADADGITIVRREGDMVRYIAEDAIAPLWAGQSFPIRQCISGIAMLQRQPIIIPDITRDPRVLLNAYLSTFVRSMAMFPVGVGEPTTAVGVYWGEARGIDPETIGLMSGFARSIGAVLEYLDARREAEDYHNRQRRAAGG